MNGKRAQARATSLLRACKCGCGVQFKPKRVDQVFASPNCKTRHTMRAYETGLKVIEGKGMHNRSMKSPQLQALYNFLACNGEPKTTREIHIATGLEAVGTAISELRRCGYRIDCKYVGRMKSGAKIFEYQLKI